MLVIWPATPHETFICTILFPKKVLDGWRYPGYLARPELGLAGYPGLAGYLAKHFSNLMGILLGPIDLPVFNISITSDTSTGTEGVIKKNVDFYSLSNPMGILVTWAIFL